MSFDEKSSVYYCVGSLKMFEYKMYHICNTHDFVCEFIYQRND